jgi:tRNA modification GTPase
LALAGGALSRQVEIWRRQVLALAAQIEAVLDFGDEADVPDLPVGFGGQAAALAAEIGSWLARPPAERLRDGVRLVVAGPPNSGKSTLINALSGRDVAITSDIPGTTRDLLEAPTALGGTPFLLIDTAGLRDSDDAIETIGVARAEASVQAADLVLWLGAPEAAPDRAICVQSKADLHAIDSRYDLAVSPLSGLGMADLVEAIVTRGRSLLPGESEVALHRRHREILGQVVESLEEAVREADPLVQAELLRGARASLDRITGRAGVEDVLDLLFGRFCIGK